MAWIYLAESAASDSLSSPGLRLSLTVSETDTLKVCSCREWLLVNSIERQSGTTLHRSGHPCCQVSTSSSEASPARTSALRVAEQAWLASAVDYSSRSCALPKNLVPYSSSLRMSLQSGQEDLDVWSTNLPAWGMIVDGQLSLPQALEPHTSESDGSYLPTPAASSYGTNKGGGAGRVGMARPSLETMARRNLWPTPRASDGAKGGPNQRGSKGQQVNLSAQAGGSLNPQWVEWLMGYQIEWTELSASATAWFRSKRVSRSKNSSAFKETT